MPRLLPFILFVALLLAAPARAQNFQPYVFGLRTAGMGGAGTAIGFDSAMPWLNPAGLARTESDTFTVAANAFYWKRVDIPRFYTVAEEARAMLGLEQDATTGGYRLEGTSIFPTSLAYLWHLGSKGEHVLALSYISPLNDPKHIEHSFRLDFGTGKAFSKMVGTALRKQEDFGTSYALKAGWLTAGVSAFLRRYQYRADLYSSDYQIDTYFNAVGGMDMQGRSRGTSWDMDLVAGVQAGPFLGGLSLGLAVHSPSLHLAGSFTDLTQYVYASTQPVREYSATSITLDADVYEERTPLWLTAGIGYERPGTFAVSVDASVYLPQDYTNTHGLEERTVIMNDDSGHPGQFVITDSEIVDIPAGSKAGFNVNAGAEFYLNPRIALRAGFFTDLTMAKDFPAEGLRTQAHAGLTRINRYGGTFGVAYAGSWSQFQLCAMFIGGFGKVIGSQVTYDASTGQQGWAFPTTDVASNTFMVVFSGEVDTGVLYSSIRSAIEEESIHRERASQPPPVSPTPPAATPPPADLQPKPAEPPVPAPAPAPEATPTPPAATDAGPASSASPPTTPPPESPKAGDSAQPTPPSPSPEPPKDSDSTKPAPPPPPAQPPKDGEKSQGQDR